MRHFADLLLNKNNSKSNDQVPFIQRRRGIEIKSSREINLMKKSSRIVATVLREINDLIKPGMSTKDLDDFAEKRIKSLELLQVSRATMDFLLVFVLVLIMRLSTGFQVKIN
jgi:Xaa-Pro aminopeptidase